MARVAPAGLVLAPRHSYEGFVEKRGPRDQGYRRVWVRLRGLTLTFYGWARDCELKVPTDLTLLPGHIFHLLEALREEQDRRATQGSPITPSPPEAPLSLVPSCFFKVTQLEAEWLLEQSGGTMVLRPGEHGQGLSGTTRQEVNGSTVLLKHYRVNHVGQGHIIDVDTLVVRDFVESSKGSLQPLQQKYSLRLDEQDPQSSTLHPAPHHTLLPPHDHGVAEELAKKLQLRQALTED